MTAAALTLALAVLIAPASPKRRLTVAAAPPVLRRAALPAVGMSLGLSAALLLPAGAALAAAIAAGCLLVRRRRRRDARRRAEEAAALQDALDVLVGELRVGAHPVAAFDVAAAEVGGEVGAALRQVAARARLGGEVAAGLRGVARRSALPSHWERLAMCWQLAAQHGLAIATLLHTAQRDIVARERFSTTVTAGMAGARTTAAVLAGLPVLGVALGQAIGADPLRFLFADGAGPWLLAVGVALACCGLLWSDRITAGALK